MKIKIRGKKQKELNSKIKKKKKKVFIIQLYIEAYSVI